MKKQSEFSVLFLVCVAIFTSCTYKKGKVVGVTTFSKMTIEESNRYFDDDVITRVAVGKDTITAICVACLNSERMPGSGKEVRISNSFNNGEYLIK